MNYVGKMDSEVVPLCDALNALPGIRTIESCCGHGETPFWIWFVADSLDALPVALYYFDGCHCGSYKWRVIAETDCGMNPVRFRVEGPTGPFAYEEANHIAALIREHVDTEESYE